MSDQLGALEELVLLISLSMHNQEVYAITVADEYNNIKEKSISIPAIHTVLRRLEKKNLVSSFVGSETHERGGRRKRIYEVTREGYSVLKEIQESRSELWKLAPKFI